MLMENRIGKSHGAEIPKKSRSLDLNSIYKSKGSKEAQHNNLKRKGHVDGSGGDVKGPEKKKSRKEVSISSLTNFNGNGSKSLEELYNGSFSKHSKLESSPRLIDGSGCSGASRTLEDSVIKIPRRKRDFVGRRKVENGSQVLKPVRPYSDKVSIGAQDGKFTGYQDSKLTGTGKGVESLKVKQKKGFDDFKENRCSESNSGRHLVEEDGHTGHSAVENGHSSLKKSRSGHSVENNENSSSKKSLRKRSRKRRDLRPGSKGVKKEAKPSIDTSVNISDDSQDDDEENLEENAARMLSSRFDPSCAGFSSNSKALTLSSTNSLSFLLSSGREFVAHGSKYLSGSESASLDTAGRVLRPRKQYKEKGNSRKRRHYYEIFSGDLDAYWVLNRRIKVFWPLDQSWYYGLVGDYDNERKLHHVKYDDRDEEWINLQNERFRLLLLPSEVPSKKQRKRSVLIEKHSAVERKKQKASKEKERDLTMEEDSHAGNYMDSVPIISWLARSTHRVKSSPLHALMKQKSSSVSSTSVPLLLSKEASNQCGCLDGGSLNGDKSKLPGNSALAGGLAVGGNKVSDVACPKDKLPVVYYRRRYRNTSDMPCHTSTTDHPDTSLVPLVSTSGVLEEHDISLGRLDTDEAVERFTVEALWLIDNSGILKLNIPFIEFRQFRFKLCIPLPSILSYSFGLENVWLCHAVSLLQCGMLITLWPRVHLEMLFIDNAVGLRFFLFEGRLKQALAFVFLVLTVFNQPNEQEKYADLQLPVTSIRFKFSCIQDFRKQLLFAFYKFSEVENSKWMYLDYKLNRHCLLAKKLPLSDCTYDNIKALVCRASTSNKGSWGRSRQWINLMGVSRESTYVNPSQSSNCGKYFRCLPPFALSFTAAPIFFLGLHLKLLMERSATHISYQDHNAMEHRENSISLLADDDSNVEDSSNRGLESNPDGNFIVSLRDANCDGCSSSSKSEPHTVDVPGCCIGNWMKSSAKYQNVDTHVETSGSSKDPGKLGIDTTIPLQKWQSKHSELEQSKLLSRSSVDRDKSHIEPHSLLNGITVQIPSFNQFGKHVKELHGVQHSSDLSWNMNGGIIPSQNPTARRSTWHRSRSSSTSLGYLSRGLSDGRADFIQNNIGNGPKRPRTQVSYALPFGGFDYSLKNKSHQQKGLLHKRIRTANEKRLSDVTRGSERNLDVLSCDANVLITLGDRGWRECGAQVVLELFDHNEWKLAVKVSGTTKYSYKAHQFLQPGSTNRYTHAMMWKGGKDWILEFADRSQWALFKEMHEECYNRNIRAASVKNIPIPGVHLIEENDDNGTEVPFIRSSKYFRQVKTDVEMALDPSRVLYDMDSDDEQWILKYRISSEVGNSRSWEISEEMFERTMDMFEKAAYSQQRDQFTYNEMEELVTGIGPMDAMKTILVYWQHKRQKKGMPLVRHLQPPLWERYQQEVKEWEVAMTKSNTPLPDGCHDKVASTDKPPMFAFCLKPRGLEVPNKGSKQRSQRKVSVAAHTFSGDHDCFHAYGRRLNGLASGDEKVVYQGLNYQSLDDSPLHQISPRVFSPRDICSTGCLSTNGDRYDRNYFQNLHRSKSKKLGTFGSSNDTHMGAYSPRMQRNGVYWWNMHFSDWPSRRRYHSNESVQQWSEHLDDSDFDELKVRDASSAAQHALNMAKLKREKAQRLLCRADLAIHKAMVALMTAEAMKGSSKDVNGDG